MHYDFDKVEVRSAGDRDPDAEDITGMSASKQRKYAAENDFENFLKGVPSAMNKKVAKELFKNIRAGMNIKEGWSLWRIAPKLDWENLREHFVGKSRSKNITATWPYHSPLPMQQITLRVVFHRSASVLTLLRAQA